MCLLAVCAEEKEKKKIRSKFSAEESRGATKKKVQRGKKEVEKFCDPAIVTIKVLSRSGVFIKEKIFLSIAQPTWGLLR